MKNTLKKLGVILGATLCLGSTVMASPISINTPNTINQEIQEEVELLASTSISSWTPGTITDVSITRNDTKYKDSYLVSKIEEDSFSAKFTIYSSTGKLFSSYPKDIRTLYGSAAATYAETNGSTTSVTYAYISTAGDYEAEVTVDYDIN